MINLKKKILKIDFLKKEAIRHYFRQKNNAYLNIKMFINIGNNKRTK